ncbi:MAG: DNA replication/repair protein RecF [Lachnospiraceae bacterium]|nr:DNA replication/repair protein RecF [Lachnospiraceae bacterium]
MKIDAIELKHYRNYEETRIEFDEGINIFYGDNAQGKTNILEAVYLAGTSKSHRGSRDRELISFGQEESHIKMFVNRENRTERVDIHLKKSKSKGIAINGIPIRKASELFGIVNVVFFSPEDLQLIKSGPGERRKFIDLELCQLDKIYVYHLVNYNKALIQRNTLLREQYGSAGLPMQLDVWDAQLIRFGTPMIAARAAFLQKLAGIIHTIHGSLSGGKEELEILYEPSASAEEFAKQLFSARERDMRQKGTTVGPHRDDISFSVNGIDIRKFGSQGQQRTAALSVKLAEIELVKELIHDTPVLLLDDVLSELDENRQNQLLNSIHGIQTMITCTGLDDFVDHRFQMDKVFHVVNGTVEREN